MMYSSYGELCTEVYDLSKPINPTSSDVKYYIERLSHVKGKVLEVGCGSGRVLIPLLQAGIAVDGLDHSIPMLESCRSRCKELNLSPHLIEGEMHDFNITSQYDSIIIPGGTFQLIEGREQAMRILQHLHACLSPGGSLIMDLFIPSDFNTDMTITKTYETSNQEVIVLEDKRIECNILEQKMVSLLKYEKWRDGSLIKSELQRLPLSWYGRYEFEFMLKELGYQEVTISADYCYKNSPTVAGQMMTYEAIKAVDVNESS
ncbi:class I SAM-dependent methyltransferase [Paenibacillus camelliae]|uniref:class I SAM-dependent methyltransferase n=1 Tax=Paenibacillus camelliae TaxID=512410 RepID=UPI002040AC71|nr:class I SAM-dependent methyltransferase [Paenibacillus camelliae]